MTTGAIIAIDQDRPGPSTSSGVPGVARKDLWLTHVVRPRCTTDTNPGGYLWTMLDKPPTSSVTITDPTLSACSFTPDVAGSYRLQLITNGGGPGNVQVLICAATKDNVGNPTNRGWRIPALGEVPPENNFDNQDRGWSEALEFIFNDVLLNGFGGGGGSPSGPAGGSLGGTYPNPAVTQADGLSGDFPVLADKLTQASGSATPSPGEIFRGTTTNATPTTIGTIPVFASSGVDILVGLVARNDGTGGGSANDVFFADLRVRAVRNGSGSPTIFGTPAPSNIEGSADLLLDCGAQAVVSGNNIAIQPIGKTGRTLLWSVSTLRQERR